MPASRLFCPITWENYTAPVLPALKRLCLSPEVPGLKAVSTLTRRLINPFTLVLLSQFSAHVSSRKWCFRIFRCCTLALFHLEKKVGRSLLRNRGVNPRLPPFLWRTQILLR